MATRASFDALGKNLFTSTFADFVDLGQYVQHSDAYIPGGDVTINESVTALRYFAMDLTDEDLADERLRVSRLSVLYIVSELALTPMPEDEFILADGSRYHIVTSRPYDGNVIARLFLRS